MTTSLLFPPGLLRGAWRTTLGVCWLALLGCPLYSDECIGHCAPGYRCEPDTGACLPVHRVPPVCMSSDQCGPSETCASDFTCQPEPCAEQGCVTAPDASAPDAAISGAAPDAASSRDAASEDGGR